MMMGRKKILIVEDEGLLARQLSDELLQMGHYISAICASGEEALDEIEAEKPDVVLMDIRLQGELDGIETAACIQKKYDIPIIYMSAYSEESIIENAAMTGPYGFLVKPISPRDLQVTIEIALYKHRTDREKAELKNKEIELLHVLSETNQFVRQIIDCAQDGIVVFDLDLRFVIWNPFMEKLSGVSAAEVLGKHPQEIFPFMRETGSIARLEKALAGEIPDVVDFPYYVQQTGKSGWASDSSAPLRNTHGDIIGVIAIVRDVSARKRAEEALSESHAMFRQILDTLPQSIFWKDRDSVYRGCNSVFARAVGLEDAEQIKGKTDFDLPWPKAEAEGYRRNDQKVITGHRPKRHRIESMQQADGTRIWIDASKVPLLDHEGHIQGILGVYEDITQRRNAEEMLIKSERRLRESQAVARLGSWDLDLVRQELEWSEETYKLFDKTREDFVPSFDEFARLVHADDLETMQKNFSRALESDDNPYHVAVRLINDSGREWVMEAFGAVRRDEDGKPLSIFGTAQDITDQKKTEEVLRQKEEMMRNLLDSVDEGFVVIDREYRILSANRAYCNQVALDPSDVMGKRCFAVSHRREQPCFESGEECAIRKVFETGEPNACLHRHMDRDNEVIFVETKAFPLKDSSGQVTSVIEVINNITEKQIIEEQRLKSQKLEAVGTLAGGIAHDFNNLLQGVFGYISLAKLNLDQRRKSLDMLEQAEKALHMSVNLTTQLLTFSKGGKPVRKRIELLPVVENAVKFALSGSSVDYKFETDGPLWSVDADEGQIGQVIQNIVLNAEQAMPGGGSVTITVNNVDAAHPALAQGHYVVISIKDSGIGIPEEHLPKIFDPYFTTKETGSGLGLATAYSIVKNHGGIIEARSEKGRGSTFSVWLPATGAVEERAEPLPASGPAVRKGRILLMDDEELVRDIAGEMIRLLGHDVEFALNGEEAIARYRESLQQGRAYDVVILDLTIRGGMGGEAAIKTLKKLDPEIKAVVSSGYADSSAISEYESLGFRTCLTKPYSLDALNDTLNSLLD